MERYFIVMYVIYYGEERYPLYGDSVIQTNGKYINREHLRIELTKRVSEEFQVNGFYITNIIEVKHEDAIQFAYNDRIRQN